MAYITCAISGMKFHTDYFTSLAIPHTEGYYHPIFVAPYRTLHELYTKHCKGELSSNDSYLLFIAFLHSSDSVIWKSPAGCNPNEQRTKHLVDNNFAQLIAVLEKSAVIRHPSFKQPKFKVTFDNNDLRSIPAWVRTWSANIDAFKRGRIDETQADALRKVENFLSRHILSGDDPKKFARVIADWADKMAEFPEEDRELWKKTIRSCFSMTKMFNTPLLLLNTIKEYCELNILAGSIHFHTLHKVLREGIARHNDFLGGSTLALGYTLLSPEEAKEAEAKNTAQLNVIISKAPELEPAREEYKTSLEFIKAKLAYRVASSNRSIDTDKEEDKRDNDSDIIGGQIL